MQNCDAKQPNLAYHSPGNTSSPKVQHLPVSHAAVHGLKAAAVALLLCLAACSPQAPPVSATSEASAVQAERRFTGSWSLTGNRQTLKMGPGHRAEIFRLGGSLMLAGDNRPGLAFRSDIIGLRDSQSGMQARSVWTDERGDQVFSELRGGAGGPGQIIEGRFVGGTGRFVGVSGQYTLRWRTLVESEDGSVSGRVVDLEGWARVVAPGETPPSGESAIGAKP
jgi:hypothetical protein